MNLLKPLLILFGTLSLGMGIIGIALPGLPTTPFLLLSAGLYLRSSEKLYRKLLANRWIGSYIIKYQTNKGLTRRGKIVAIATMWAMIALSCLVIIVSLPIKMCVLAAGFIGTFVMGYLIPTVPVSKSNNH